MQTETVTRPAERPGTCVYLDLDTALLEARWEPRGPELHLRPGVGEGLARLRQVADHVVVLVEPPAEEDARRPDLRVEVLQEALGADAAGLLIVGCQHQDDETGEALACDCRKPGTGLIDDARRIHGLDERSGWHIGGDQTGVHGARSAGLRTIRVGPVAEDHLSVVHRADNDARDLLAAANVVLMEALTAA